jgi:hypothetical protein
MDITGITEGNAVEAGPPMHAHAGILARNESSPSGRVIANEQSAPPGRGRWLLMVRMMP